MAKFYVSHDNLQVIYNVPSGKPIDAAVRAYEEYSQKRDLAEGYFFISEGGFRCNGDLDAMEDTAISTRKASKVSIFRKKKKERESD